MGSLRGTGPLIWQRIVTSWRLLAVLGFGMLVAATLLAASPVYTRVMNDLGLESALKNRLGRDTRSTGFQVNLPLGSQQAADEATALTRILSDEVGWFTADAVRYGSIKEFDLTREGEAVSDLPLRPLVQVHTMQGFEEHVRILSGQPARATGDPSAMEVLVPAESARIFRLQPGDRIVAHLSYDDCVRLPPPSSVEEAQARSRFPCIVGAKASLQAVFTVAGIVEQKDANEAYWSAGRISFLQPLETEGMGPVFQVILPEETYFRALPLALPRVPSLFQISAFADVTAIDSASMPEVRQSIDSLRDRLEERGALADTPMGFALADFNQRASFNQVTLLLLLLQVVGIAIYYVLLVSSLLVERRAEEIAMLRSRGASVLQIVGLSAAEAAFLAIIVAAIAPFLASAMVSLLGLTGTFEDVSGGGLLAYTVVPQSFLLGMAGALLAAVAVIVPAFFTARQGMVVFLRGNARAGPPFMQRYYIDVGLALLAALALWQVNQQGSVFDPESVGGWSADPLLLLSPLLVIVAVGALMFRFLPFLIGLAGRALGAIAGPTSVTLGLWQMTRSPSRYTQLALLVVMAAAVGTFAATYGETTERSQEERARFEAGVDMRITRLNRLERSGMSRIEEQLSGIQGVELASAAFRDSSSLGPLAAGGRGVDLLAVNPVKAAEQLWFRNDFATTDIQTLMQRLEGSATTGLGLDLGDAQAVSLWINPTAARGNTMLWLRTVDARGIYRLHEVSRLDFTGYRQFTVPMDGNTAYPVQLVGMLMTQPSVTDLTRGELLIDDIAAVDATGVETIVEDFESGLQWNLLRTPTRTRDNLVRSSLSTHGGSGAAAYQFLAGQTTAVRGIAFANPNMPLPAIASSGFLDANRLEVGDETELVIGDVLLPVIIAGSVDYFPTLSGSSNEFLILNIQHVLAFAELTLRTNDIQPTEAWLTVSGNAEDRNAAYLALANQYGIEEGDVVDVQRLLTSVANDPLIRAGGNGVLLIALVAAFAILALGFGLTLYLGGQARSLEVSVLRAVGLAPRQVFTMICLEYLLVAVIGLIVGTLAGLRISATMLGFLNVTEDGSRLMPPFSLATQWDTVAIAFLATAVAFMVGIAALAGYFLRLPVSRVLRLTR